MAKVIYEKRGNSAYVTLNRPEAMTGCSGVANPRVPDLLKAFADKTDKGRVGKHKTDL
jgi:hypothetical protein